MAAKKKYVPGRAIQRAQMSARDTGIIHPSHLTGIRIGVELALESLLTGKGFDQHCWDTLFETVNVTAALDQLYHRAHSTVTLTAEINLRILRNRCAQHGEWIISEADATSMTNLVRVYHEVITQTTYNQLDAACTLVERRTPKKD